MFVRYLRPIGTTFYAGALLHVPFVNKRDQVQVDPIFKMKREKNPTKPTRKSRSSIIWSAVPSAPHVFQYSTVSCDGAVAPKGPMTYGTIQGDS